MKWSFIVPLNNKYKLKILGWCLQLTKCIWTCWYLLIQFWLVCVKLIGFKITLSTGFGWVMQFCLFSFHTVIRKKGCMCIHSKNVQNVYPYLFFIYFTDFLGCVNKRTPGIREFMLSFLNPVKFLYWDHNPKYFLMNGCQHWLLVNTYDLRGLKETLFHCKSLYWIAWYLGSTTVLNEIEWLNNKLTWNSLLSLGTNTITVSDILFRSLLILLEVSTRNHLEKKHQNCSAGA